MKKKSTFLHRHALRAMLLFSVFVLGLGALPAQNRTYRISGVIYESARSGKVPLPYAVVGIPEYSAFATTNSQGEFTLASVAFGEVTLHAEFLGKVSIDTLIRVQGDLFLELTLLDDNFRLQDVVVTAQASKSGLSSSSTISRSAMDHLQANSLKDVLGLLPGQLTENPNLTNLAKINLRGIPTTLPGSQYALTGDEVDMNSMGVSIIQDGSPLSNNANLQILRSATSASNSRPGETASPTSGLDARMISVENIESVEVIDGIASVEYGDVTAGAIIIQSKAGRSPLRINARTNPVLYSFSAGAGYNLGEDQGALNVGVGYARNVNTLDRSYVYFQRTNAQVMYSNTFWNGRLNSNTSLDLIFAQGDRENRRDDTDNYEFQNRSTGIKLTTNGTYNLDLGWFKTIRYVFSANFTAKDDWSQSQTTGSVAAPYSGATEDGAVVSNRPDETIRDNEGNGLAGPNPDGLLGRYINRSYLSRYTIEGREINLYAKLSGTLVKTFGTVNNRILFGADFRSEGNEGKGLNYDPETPPIQSSTSAGYSTTRPRDFRDIPWLNSLGVFAEENFSWNFTPERRFQFQAGVRYDKLSTIDGLWSPRFNASVDIVPRVFSLRGGWGTTGKLPTLSHLYPETAYFEIENLNTIPQYGNDPQHQYLVTTTRAFDTRNPNLKMAKNIKSEIGFDLRFKQYLLNVTAYQERMNNGYKSSLTLDSFHYTTHREYKYQYNETAEGYEIVHAADHPVFLSYYTYTNNLVLNKRGIQFNLNLGRFDAIRTALVINGAWMRSESYDKGYTFYSKSMNGRGSAQQFIGVYQPEMDKFYVERFVTAARATYNIPELGFVVTLTGEFTWSDKNWHTYTGDDKPLWYLSQEDGRLHDFPYDDPNDPDMPTEFRNTVRNSNAQNSGRKNSYGPLACFNINVTKELGEVMRVSFFANNMFRNYPLTKNFNGVISQRNPKYFFGVELSLIIK